MSRQVLDEFVRRLAMPSPTRVEDYREIWERCRIASSKIPEPETILSSTLLDTLFLRTFHCHDNARNEEEKATKR